MKFRFRTAAAAACAASALAAGLVPQAAAAEMKLKAGFYSTSQKSQFRLTFNQFVDKVNADGKGQVDINQVVDTAAVPRDQMPKALKDGILDIIVVPPSVLDKLLPGMGALSASRVSTADMRKNGTFDLVNAELAKVANARLVSLYSGDVQFYIFTNKPVRTFADFKGKRLRATNTNREAFKALGVQPLQVGHGEIYTAMQRGVIDGYANINNGLWASSWAEVVKYRIDPGFFQANLAIFVNNSKWKAMSDKQKALIDTAGRYVEGEPSRKMAAADEADAQRAVKEKGLEIVKLSGDDAKKFLDTVYAAQWDSIVANAKDFGPKLRAKIAK